MRREPGITGTCPSALSCTGGLKVGNSDGRCESSGVLGEAWWGGKRESTGVSNSASVLAAASIDEIQSVSLNPLASIHWTSAEMYSEERDLCTGERCWITVKPEPFVKTAQIRSTSSLESPGHMQHRENMKDQKSLTFKRSNNAIISIVRGSNEGEAEGRI